MAKTLKDLRPVYVVGVGWHRYQPLSDTPYVMLGLPAIRQALSDAGIAWPDVESSYIGTGLLGMAAGRAMLKHLGATGRPLVHIENASASGSAAFRHACIEVAAGIADVSLVIGIDKPGPVQRALTKTGIGNLADDAIVPFTHFALLTNEYAHRHGVKPEDVALVAVKNHRNGALNPNAHRQQARSLDEILGGKPISGTLTTLQCCPVALVAVKNHRNGALNPNAHRQQARSLDEILGGKPISGTLTTLQCCPVGEGAAAAIIASEDAIKRLGIDPGRVVRVTASAAASEGAGAHATADAAITKDTIADALHQAGLAPNAVDVLELHDAFTVEELHYVEAMGVCKPGQAIHLLKEGAFDIGGQMAVSASGGLIAMGHPIGPTGVGQIGEVALQLRGEAGARQHKGAKVGLAHMVGLGAVCYAHVLQKP